MNRLTKNEENIKPLFEGCLHCGGCKIWCPFDLAVGDLLEGVAIDLFEEHNVIGNLQIFANRISNHNGLYPVENYASSRNILDAMQKGDVYYFPGCVTMGNNPKVISCISKIASNADEELIAKPKERVCCGAPTIYYGDEKLAKKLAKTNYDQIKDSGAKYVICECPECVHTLKEEYPKLGFEFDIPVYHITEWIAKLVKENKIKFVPNPETIIANDSLPISYHDPCILSRKLKVVKEPYYVLKKIFAENFKETSNSRELTHCCGFGGVVNVVNSDLANKISQNRLDEFSVEGIKTIVTSCPTCWYSFMRNNTEFEFEIIDFVELISNLLAD
jgi:Fe-S oxidoreductase